MGPSEGPKTIINGLSDVKLVKNDTSLDFEFFDPHSYPRGGGGMGSSGGPETIINGLSDVKLVENDTSLDFEFFDPHPHPGVWEDGILGGT